MDVTLVDLGYAEGREDQYFVEVMIQDWLVFFCCFVVSCPKQWAISYSISQANEVVAQYDELAAEGV